MSLGTTTTRLRGLPPSKQRGLPNRTNTAQAILDIQLFGAFQASDEGQALPKLPRRQSERLWIYLLLQREAGPLDRGEAAELLLPDSAKPRDGLRLNLHALLKHLPKAPEGVPWVLSDRATLRWNPEADCRVDLDALEAIHAELAAADRGAGKRPDVDRMVEVAGLSAEPLLSDQHDDWVLAARDRAERLRKGLLDALVEDLVAAERSAEALDWARARAEMDPLDELGQRLLIERLAAEGSRSAALQSYMQLRERLAETLGVEPEPETEALAERIRSGDVGADSDAASGAEAPNGPMPLPEIPEPHVERAALEAQLAELVGAQRLLTLTGPAGVGKSRLALALAHQAEALGLPTVGWINLAAADEDEALSAVIGHAVGMGQGLPLAQLVDRLGGTPRLLVFDHAESWVEPLGDLVLELLRALPELRILIGSRQRLGVYGEALWSIPPAECPADGKPENPYAASEAGRLFLAHFVAAGGEAAPGPEDCAAIAVVCRGLDGLPLALAAAGRWSAEHGPRELASSLDRALDLLGSGGAGTGSDGREGSLGESIAEGLVGLPEEERSLLMALAAEDQAFGFDAVRARVAEGELVDALDALESLVTRSLILVSADGEEGRRYRLPRLLRQAVRAADWTAS